MNLDKHLSRFIHRVVLLLGRRQYVVAKTLADLLADDPNKYGFKQTHKRKHLRRHGRAKWSASYVNCKISSWMSKLTADLGSWTFQCSTSASVSVPFSYLVDKLSKVAAIQAHSLPVPTTISPNFPQQS